VQFCVNDGQGGLDALTSKRIYRQSTSRDTSMDMLLVYVGWTVHVLVVSMQIIIHVLSQVIHSQGSQYYLYLQNINAMPRGNSMWLERQELLGARFPTPDVFLHRNPNLPTSHISNTAATHCLLCRSLPTCTTRSPASLSTFHTTLLLPPPPPPPHRPTRPLSIHDVRRSLAVPDSGAYQCRQPVPSSLLYHHVQ
jgi:hypothetical protein